jgi:hypothetical protein
MSGKQPGLAKIERKASLSNRTGVDMETGASTSGRDAVVADMEKQALLERRGSKTLRAAVAQAPREVRCLWLARGCHDSCRHVPLLVQACYTIVHSWFSRKFGTGW